MLSKIAHESPIGTTDIAMYKYTVEALLKLLKDKFKDDDFISEKTKALAKSFNKFCTGDGCKLRRRFDAKTGLETPWITLQCGCVVEKKKIEEQFLQLVRLGQTMQIPCIGRPKECLYMLSTQEIMAAVGLTRFKAYVREHKESVFSILSLLFRPSKSCSACIAKERQVACTTTTPYARNVSRTTRTIA